jgi:endonuclease/exonuclease/phosphatase family metal-dependent hydrolase
VRFRIVTYNVHKCRGLDGRVRPDRVARVLREVHADIVALQEVLSVPGGPPEGHQAEYLAGALGLNLRLGVTRTLRGGSYGNAILSRFALGKVGCHDLSVAGREPRGCLRAEVVLGRGCHLHVFNVHLGTAYRERRLQGRKLVEGGLLDRPEEQNGPRIVLGDFNEWAPGLASRLLRARFNSVDVRTHLRRRRTYPGMLPILHLDHIYFDDPLELDALILHRTRSALLASDHLPLVADFRWDDRTAVA